MAENPRESNEFAELWIGDKFLMNVTPYKEIPENKPLELRLEIDGKTYRYDLIPKEGAEDER